jgi:hypothetical protein
VRHDMLARGLPPMSPIGCSDIMPIRFKGRVLPRSWWSRFWGGLRSRSHNGR